MKIVDKKTKKKDEDHTQNTIHLEILVKFQLELFDTGELNPKHARNL